MSYLVLARKWRPQTFEEVVGQPAIVRTLQNAIRAERIAHAFLFTGPRGVGKTSVARILAKSLNCVQGPTPTPCNTCDACNEITKGIAPDVFEIDGASNTGVDHVRDLQETLKYRPQKHRFKVFIVDEVHMLSTPAFNAFLKTLEEPPAHVIFIFATTEPHKILDTVIDRCQRYDFRKVPPQLIHSHLQLIAQKEQVAISSDSLQLIAREADGSLRDAQSMLDRIMAYADTEISDQDVADVLGVVGRSNFAETAAAVLRGDLKKCVEILRELSAHGVDVGVFYRGLVEHFRNLVVAKINPHPQLFPDLGESEIHDLVAQSREVNVERLQSILKVLIETERYLHWSSLPSIALEAMLIRVASLPSVSSIHEILTNLARLQEKVMDRPGEKAAEPPVPFAKTTGSEEKELARAVSSPPAPYGSDAQGKGEKDLLAFLRMKKPLLASQLEHGTLVRKGPHTLEIGFSKNSIFLESIQEAEKSGEFAKLCEEFFGEKTTITIRSHLPNVDQSAKQRPELSESQRIEKIKKEAREHPLVKEALSIFGGGITEVKVIGS